jgi:signal transduction histidine kinase
VREPLPADPTLADLEDARERAMRMSRWTRPLVVVLLLVLLAAGLRTDPRPSPHGTGLVVLAALVLIGVSGCALVLDLRFRPWASGPRLVECLVLIAGSAALAWFDPNGPGFLGGFLAVGAAGARMSRRTGIAVTTCAMLALAVAGLAGEGRPLMSIVVSELGLLAFHRLGLYTRRLWDRTAQAERLLAELEQTRAAQVEAAALGERQRLAREMHDVLAHSLSGLLLHLEAARLLAERERVPARLSDTIDRAHHLAEAGLGEARQAIGTLRDVDLPGPDRLRELAGDFRRDSGIDCELTESGSADLGAQQRLTLYRVAQEALTNIRKHARPARVRMCLEHERDGTRLTVEDIGVPVTSEDDHGYGVTGMRERAELLGGTLTAGPTGTGFRVVLWLPA